MKELVVAFGVNGEVQAMHLDAFDLAFLGPKEVQRATEIKFDSKAQSWGLHLPTDDGLYYPARNADGFSSYEVARAFEVSWVNICRAHEHPLTSRWAELALHAARKRFGDDHPPTLEEFDNAKCV